MGRFNTTTGFPTPAAEKAHSLDLNELIIYNRASTYFLRASGDCLKLGICNGDILVIDRSLNPCDGDIAVVVKDDSLQLKEIIPSEVIHPSFPDEWQERFFGIVTWVIHKAK